MRETYHYRIIGRSSHFYLPPLLPCFSLCSLNPQAAAFVFFPEFLAVTSEKDSLPGWATPSRPAQNWDGYFRNLGSVDTQSNPGRYATLSPLYRGEHRGRERQSQDLNHHHATLVSCLKHLHGVEATFLGTLLSPDPPLGTLGVRGLIPPIFHL